MERGSGSGVMNAFSCFIMSIASEVANFNPCCSPTLGTRVALLSRKIVDRVRQIRF